MSWAALVLAAATAAPLPCGEVEARVERLRATESLEDLEAQLQRLQREAGGPLALPSDAQLDRAERAEKAARRLELICALASRPSPSQDAPDRKLLQEILSRPELADGRQPSRNVFAPLFAWLEVLLGRYFESRGALTFAQTARVAVLALALGSALYAALRIAAARRRRTTAPAQVPRAAQGTTLEDPAVHLERARAALAHDGREAIREGLLGLLSTLERRRWARPDRTRTNRELAAELPERGAPQEVSEATLGLVDWYDRAFYSLQPVSTDEATRFLAQVEQLRVRLAGGEA